MTAPEIIAIEGKNLLIAAGAFSSCYRHPENPAICIKLPTSAPRAGKRLRADLAYFRKLHAKKTDLTYLSDHLGPCLTDLGPGHLFEHITDPDGSTSKTLGYYLTNEPKVQGEMIEALEELAAYLLKNRIMISDLHERNILLRLEIDKRPTAMVIDGIGDRVAIQILNIFGSLVDSKVTRRWNRFVRKLLVAFPSFEVPEGRLYLPEKK